MIYFFRLAPKIERQRDDSSGEWTLKEWTRRRWKLSKGDVLLIGEGKNLEIKFKALTEVIESPEEGTQVPNPENNDKEDLGFQRVIRAKEVKELPEDRTLGRLMYSLEKVSNFSKPGLNLRHHGIIDAGDLETIVSGKVHGPRSLYFGMLQYLPQEWRQYMDLTARRSEAAHAVLARDSPDKRNRASQSALPAYEILAVARDSVVEPVQMAMTAKQLFDGLGVDFQAPFAESEETKLSANWLNDLLQGAEEHAKSLMTLHELLAVEAKEMRDQKDERKWRQHRW